MAENKLRVALDTNVLIAGVRFPRWPHEVMEAAVEGRFEVMLPAVFLREVVGWSSEALEAIRFRYWEDVPTETSPGEPAP